MTVNESTKVINQVTGADLRFNGDVEVDIGSSLVMVNKGTYVIKKIVSDTEVHVERCVY